VPAPEGKLGNCLSEQFANIGGVYETLCTHNEGG